MSEQPNTQATPEEPEVTFEDFDFRPSIAKGIKEAGFKIPSPIQKEAIPAIMDGRDVIAQAQTGTGKTAAFGLPAMNRLEHDGSVEILIITPTRELASQVSDEMFRLGRFDGVKTVAVYGGQSIRRQVDLISRGAQVVIATPGRLLDHLKSDRLSNFAPTTVILDEADEMLDMGFIDDIRSIFQFLPTNRQTLLFSATMPPAIKQLAEEILIDPVTIKVAAKETTNTDITQQYYVIEEHEREHALVRLIDHESPEKSIIFCRTKKETDQLGTTLISRGYQAKALHGDMEQRTREEAIKSFKQGKIDFLVATDVAARGLDVTGVTHVFNYHIPLDPESYVHRIGRTGRAGKKGLAITLVTPLEFKELKRIQHTTKATMNISDMPTLGDVREKTQGRMVEQILSQPLKDEAAAILSMLEESIDINQIAYKLISMVLERQNVVGPERIGIAKEKAEAMFHRSRERNDRNNNRGGYRGRSNRSNSGNRSGSRSGGGYRGNSSGGGRRRP